MRLELLIDGMFAVHAKHAVFTALGAIDGLRRADVELGRAVVELEARSGTAPEGAIREALLQAGCTLRGMRELPRSLPTL